MGIGRAFDSLPLWLVLLVVGDLLFRDITVVADENVDSLFVFFVFLSIVVL